MSDADDIRRFWGVPELSGLWSRVREVLESPEPPATFRLELPDEETRRAVGAVVGRPMTGLGTRISVSRLDANLRENTRYGLGVEQVLEILDGRPVARRESPSAARAERRERNGDVLRAALAGQGLAGTAWAEPWIAWVHRYGRIAEADLEQLAHRAAAVLARLVLDPGGAPQRWVSRADLAARYGGGAHELDNGSALTRLVLRAAALAHGVDAPGNERERRALWERCGVALDAVSATALCWALPVDGADPWSESIRRRTSAGLPAHLSHLDMGAAPDRLVEAGSVIAVCENPRVLEAAVQEGVGHPLVCVAGQPSTVVLELLRRLSACGAVLRYHGDLDWAGLLITRSVLSVGEALPWRMSAGDYREAVDRASAGRVDLPVLVGSPVESPWDPDLAGLMATVGKAVEEEVVLTTLLDDLRAGLA